MNIAYLAALIALLIFYFGNWLGLSSVLPHNVDGVPLGIVWWGALGGVLSSTSAIVNNAQDWDESKNLWHALKPALAAVSASVSMLLIAAIVAVLVSNLGSARYSPIVYLVAFVIGYREDLFRAVLRKITTRALSQKENTPEK